MNRAVRFHILFQQAYPGLRRYALHRGLESADADDLVAATLEVAWRRLDDVPADNPLPWLYGVARNLIRNARRQERSRNALRARLSAQAQQPQPGETGPLDLGPGELRHALAQLSDDDQELLKLIAWDGLSPAQAAAVLDCSPAAVRTRLHRARNRLAARLALDPRTRYASASRRIPADGDH